MKHLYFVLITALVMVVQPAIAKEKPIYTSTLSTLAVSGYDSVAYFTDGKPVKGKKVFTYKWKDTKWRFANAENLAKFKANPDSFAPQYGGYCAWAVSQGYTAPTDPEAWQIVGGKLYLNYSKSVQRQWMEDIPGNISKADRNVKNLLAQ
ncbi:MAG: YHS domain-containing protein [Alphaproteobacteria bacterium]|nr:YHS domain-containing protein [Alphaproteobacteria bacterium]